MLKPFFRHYGSKWRLSAHLPAPRHGKIVELFGGAGGYSCRWYDRDVTLIDCDPDTVSIWHYLQRATPGDILSLPGELPSTDIREMGLAREEMLLIQRWLTPQGGRANWWTPPSCLRLAPCAPSSFWGVQIRARIAAQLDAIRHWRIVLGSWDEHVDLAPATWIVDPPYQTQQHNRAGYGAKGARGVDFDTLGRVCRVLRGQVIAHEQEGADWLPFSSWRMSNTGARGRREEFLWLGGVEC